MRAKGLQEGVLSRGQPYHVSRNGYLSAFEVNCQIAGADDRLSRREVSRVAQRDSDARQQLVHTKRLRQVVVRAEVQGRDLLCFLAAGRKHDDRCSRAVANSTNYLSPVDVGEPQVQ